MDHGCESDELRSVSEATVSTIARRKQSGVRLAESHICTQICQITVANFWVRDNDFDSTVETPPISSSFLRHRFQTHFRMRNELTPLVNLRTLRFNSTHSVFQRRDESIWNTPSYSVKLGVSLKGRRLLSMHCSTCNCQNITKAEQARSHQIRLQLHRLSQF